MNARAAYLAAAFLVGLVLGQVLVGTARAAGDGWERWQINRVIQLLEQIAKNTEK